MIRDEVERRIVPDLEASGSVSVTFVYPTRNRPDFVREALEILRMQRGGNFEVIVSDNYTDPSLSCRKICSESNLANLQYLRPPTPLSLMAESWEFPLATATGEYVAYLTDKMFILPNAMRRIEDAILTNRPEIISWVADIYHPDQYPDYFGRGRYEIGQHGPGGPFSPGLELDRRGRTGRSAHSQPDYCRGKIVFGAFHRDLIKRCIQRFGFLFHPLRMPLWRTEPGRNDWNTTGLSPDYTSMILGLSEARSAFEMTDSCVLQIYTDISGGALIDTKDEVARAALDQSIWNDLPIPGLYASQHNIVAHDYVALKKRFDLPFDFDIDVWASHCSADIYRPTREWSNGDVEFLQKDILERFMAARQKG